MSNEAINWAYAQTVETSGAKFVLVALADFADQEWSCFPSQERLAAMTRQSVRTVRRQLVALEEAGLLTRQVRRDSAGQRTTDRYYLLPDKMTGREVNQPDIHDIPTGQKQRYLPDTMTGYPLKNPQKNHMVTEVTEVIDDDVTVEAPPVALDPTRPAPKSAPVAAVDAEFTNSWWPAYPRKVAKGAALRAYRAARRKASLDVLLAGVDAYRRGKPDYADFAHPASWLNGERWADEYAPAAPEPAYRPAPDLSDLDPDDVEGYIAAMQGGRR